MSGSFAERINSIIGDGNKVLNHDDLKLTPKVCKETLDKLRVNLRDVIQRLVTEIEQLQRTNLSLTAEAADKKGEYDKKLASLDDTIHVLKSTTTSNEDKIRAVEEELKTLSQQNQQISSENDALKQTLQDKEAQNTSLTEKLRIVEGHTQEKEILFSENTDLKNKLQVADVQAQAKYNEYVQAVRQSAGLINKNIALIASLSKQNDELKAQLETAKLAEPSTDTRGELETTKAELDKLKETLVEQDNVLEPVEIDLTQISQISGGRHSRKRVSGKRRRSRKSL